MGMIFLPSLSHHCRPSSIRSNFLPHTYLEQQYRSHRNEKPPHAHCIATCTSVPQIYSKLTCATARTIMHACYQCLSGRRAVFYFISRGRTDVVVRTSICRTGSAGARASAMAESIGQGTRERGEAPATAHFPKRSPCFFYSFARLLSPTASMQLFFNLQLTILVSAHVYPAAQSTNVETRTPPRRHPK